MTLLTCILTRVCVLLNFVCALAHRVVKILLEHFTMAILYEGHVMHHQSCQRVLESCRNLGLILDLITAIPVYQIGIIMKFYQHTLNLAGINEFNS